MSTRADEQKSVVHATYSRVARQGASCCGGGAGTDLVQMASLIGYSKESIAAAPEGANLGLGCGAPLEVAAVQPGETVLDLGAGAGFDAFIARRIVGESGRVLGVDMTYDMVLKARENAAKIGLDNVEFRLGEIEHMPIDSASVDLVISNCVLNLVPDKDAAFAEIARVLKPGGRMCVSDVVLNNDLPQELIDSAAAYAGCVSGAIRKDDYLAKLEAAGLERVEVVREVDAKDIVLGAGCCDEEPALAQLTEGMVASVTVKAWKPMR